jgi:trehalose 6-phosphate phosphatase
VVSLGTDLTAAVDRLAGVDRLLVASDYDGVLAPIVTDPAAARPLPAAVAALVALADLPGTTVAVISGRARRDLATLSGLPPRVALVGSHGGEFDRGFGTAPQVRDRRDRLAEALRRIAAGRPGVALEVKPASVAVHTRNAERPVAAEVADAVRRGPATWPQVHLITGKEVLELAVLKADKGTAVTALRERAGAGAVLFVGDDVTDEDAFAVLREPDVGVKVGPGPTAARFRVPDPEAVVTLLDLVLRSRSAAR